MRALVQRVSSASVTVAGERVGEIGQGLLVLVGVGRDDREADAAWIARKVKALRVFDGSEARRGLSVEEIGGEVLCVSQFTLYGDTRRGSRPSYAAAAPPERAEPLYKHVRDALGGKGGRFGEHMEVTLVGDGPVTLLLESPTPV